MLDVKQLVDNQLPALKVSIFYRPIEFILKHILHEQDLQQYEKSCINMRDFSFVAHALNYFRFHYDVNDNEQKRIPATGRVVIMANHPIGSLDALALLDLISRVRHDVKIVANQFLMAIPHMQALLLPVNNMQGGTERKHINAITKHLQNEGALIIFPAGEVSRLRPQGIRDTRWQSGFLRIAMRAKAPILPVHIQARNSNLFYLTSMLYKPLSSLLLIKEMYKQQHKSATFRVGEVITYEHYNSAQVSLIDKVSLLRKHLYRIGKNKPPIFRTQMAIAPPEDRGILAAAMTECKLIGQTYDGKKIYLYHGTSSASTIIRELGRLREIAFRAVGEGTGQWRDVDDYDSYYYHILLWDSNALEIVGAYRLLPAKDTVAQQDIKKLYTASLFEYDEDFYPYLAKGIELGRSFIQPKYWGKRSLDYLWYGIGAFLHHHPEYEYLFGAVSISNNMPKQGKDLLIYFYNLYFSHTSSLAVSKLKPYQLDNTVQSTLRSTFKGNDYNADYMQLKHLLANMGCGVPTLYKQYAELCEPGGVHFLAFNIDPNFNDCIDGLILVNISKLKPKKAERYILRHTASTPPLVDNHQSY